LFVKPNTNTGGPGGAIQDMNYVRPLVKRVKASGAQLDLDLHYSDTWADPGKQFKPADWANLDFDALVQKVHDYTADVLKQLAADGTSPDIVQIGNEITAGMIWPDGKVGGVPEAQRAEQWAKVSRLLNAGAKAVREAQTPNHKIRVMIHIDNGGKAGTPQNFFRQLSANPVDFDIIGLSFYPEWGGSMPALKQNMSDIIGTYHKDVIIAETSYFWKPMTLGKYDTSMLWPETPAGQKQFTADLAAVINAAPEHHGLGFIWWYPESINLPNRRMWRSGADALWDDTGNALPALTELFTAPATQP
jgi:arabinogalactan endo-1,4-beta-galactosidase